MRLRSVIILCGMLIGAILLALTLRPATAQNKNGQKRSDAETGYAVKKPVFGGSCDHCPWGAMAEIVKTAMSFYGWDVQICYSCAGGPRAGAVSRRCRSAAETQSLEPTSPRRRMAPWILGRPVRSTFGGPIRAVMTSLKIRKDHGSSCAWSPTSRTPTTSLSP